MEGCISRSRAGWERDIRVACRTHIAEKLCVSRKNAKEVFATIESYEIARTGNLWPAAKNSARDMLIRATVETLTFK